MYFRGYIFQEQSVLQQFYIGATGSTRFTLSLGDFSRVEIRLPSLPEQQKIASILTSVDEVIEKTQTQINKLQDLKKATMNELLTRGIGHTEFKDSPVGRIPKSWENTSISKCCNIKNNLRKPISREERDKMKGVFPYYGATKLVDHLNEYRIEGEYTLIGEDGDHFKKFSDYLKQKTNIEKDKEEAINAFIELGENFGVSQLEDISKKKPTHDLNDVSKQVMDKYAMLEHLEFGWSKSKAMKDDIVNYVNVIDVCDASKKD